MGNIINLGKLVDSWQQREAVHIAVVPVLLREGGHKPGDRIGVKEDWVGRYYATEGTVGIIDPFLPPDTRLWEDDVVWMLVMPNTVTGMRHMWEHPAMMAKEPSYCWMSEFAKRCGRTFEEMMQAATKFLVEGSLLYGGNELLVDFPSDFWSHYQILTGQVVTEENPGPFFKCAC